MTTIRRTFAMIGTTFAVAALFLACPPGRAAAGQPEQPDAQARTLPDPEGAIPSAAELPELIRPDHPRLFMNEELWPGMRARALGEANEEYREMLEVVDGLPPLEAIEAQEWGKELAAGAFVYRVTRDKELLAKIKRMLEKSVDFYDQVLAADTITNVNAGAVREAHLDYAYTRLSWLAAFDWVYNDLPAPDRTDLCSRMVRHVHAFMERFAPHHHSWHGSFYYWDNMLWYAGLTLLNPELPGQDYERALAILQKGYNDHCKMLTVRTLARGDDGDFQYPRVEYALPATIHSEWKFYHSWRAAVSEEIPRPWFGPAALYANGVFWNLLPGLRHYGLENSWHKGNHIAGYEEFSKQVMGGYCVQHAYFYQDSHPDMTNLSRVLWKRTGFARGGKYGYLPIWSAIWSPAEEDPQAQLPGGLPLARHFEESNILFLRSGSTETDTYALFNIGGGPVASVQRDATQFTIYKQGFLALDTGTRNSRPHERQYTKTTFAHNCVLIGDSGQTQGHHGHASLARAFETNRLFAYAVSDATDLYPEDKCAQMVRQFLFLAPDHFVVFDRVTATQAEHEKRWLLHTAYEPVISGKEFRADQEEGRIFCRTLVPADAELTTIGGPGKEFWARGQNWPLSDDWWERFGKQYNWRVPDTMGRWRVDVTPGAAREQDYFLHLIQASDQSVEEMVESDVSENEDQIELTFSVGARTHTIALNKTGEVGGHIRIEEDGAMLVNRPLTQRIMPQAGLALED